MSQPKVFRLNVSNLGQAIPPKLFIHVECYCSWYKQKGKITVEKEGDPGTLQEFKYGPVNTKDKYTNPDNWTYPIENNTSYIVKLWMQNDKGRGQWTDNRIHEARGVNIQPSYHDVIFLSEDIDEDYFNDTIVRLVWWSDPNA